MIFDTTAAPPPLCIFSVNSIIRSTLFEYLNKEYRISVNRMAPDNVFLLLINPPSKNKPVQKVIASLKVGRKFTGFALLYFVFEGNFQVQAPQGPLFGGAI